MPWLAFGFTQFSNQWEQDLSPEVKQVRMWSWPHLHLINMLRMRWAIPSLSIYLHDVVLTKQNNNFIFEESVPLGYDNLKYHGSCIISLLGFFSPEDNGTMILQTTCSRTLVDWFAVRVTPMHLGLEATGPLCTTLSSFRQLQRRYTLLKRQRPLLEREEIGREMASKFCLWPNFHVITGFFNMPQICNMGQTALIPFRRKKSDGFGRVWTRELGYQRPAW
jgi:hypothetical protein